MRLFGMIALVGLAFPVSLNADDALVREVILNEPDLTESSGLAFSLRAPGYVWTHNDSGDKPRLWCFDSQTGARTGSCELYNTEAVDWEAMANYSTTTPDGKSQPMLIVGDCGDNQRRRSHLTLYRFDEPDPNADAIIPPEQWRSLNVRFPDGPLDCEAIWFDSEAQSVVLLAKSLSPLTSVYALKLSAFEQTEQDASATCTKIATLAMPLATGGDRDPQTGDVWIATYWRAYCFKRGNNQTLRSQFANVPLAFTTPAWKQIESIGVDDQSRVWVTTEGTPAKLGMLNIPSLSK